MAAKRSHQTPAKVGDRVAVNVSYPDSIHGTVLAIEQEAAYLDEVTGDPATLRFASPLYVIDFGDYRLVENDWHPEIESRVFQKDKKCKFMVMDWPPKSRVLKLFRDEFTVIEEGGQQ